MDDLWYALHVRPRFEKCVHTQLCEKGYESFLPVSTVRRKWSDRVKTLSLPMFPGYVFCRFDIHSRLPILVTPGVNSIVGFGKTLVPIDETEISTIGRLVQSGLEIQPCPYLNAGDRVHIEHGPLAGLTGIVVRAKNQDRLLVSITLLMRSVSVEIDISSVTRVGEDARVNRIPLPAAARDLRKVELSSPAI